MVPATTNFLTVRCQDLESGKPGRGRSPGVEEPSPGPRRLPVLLPAEPIGKSSDLSSLNVSLYGRWPLERQWATGGPDSGSTGPGNESSSGRCFLVALVAPEKFFPTPNTPGFALASPRAFQVLMALYAHAVGHRLGSEVDSAEPPSDDGRSIPSIDHEACLEAEWTLDQLARVCGCHRNVAGGTLAELVDLGWIRKSLARHKGGEFSGFHYRLLVPPTTLNNTARHRYQQKIEEAEMRLRERSQRINESAGLAPDYCDEFKSPQTGEE